jgi:hypothetical protein
MADDIQTLSALQEFPFYLDYQRGVNFDLIEGYSSVIFGPYAPLQIVDDVVDKALRVRMDFTFYSRQELHGFLAFMDYHKGRLKKFWLYCNTNEFLLQNNVPPNNFTLDCYNSAYPLVFKDGDRVYLILKNGDTIVRKLASAETNELGTVMTLACTTGLPASGILLSDVLEFGRVLCCRFDHGSFELNYKTAEVSQVSLRFFELVKEYPA